MIAVEKIGSDWKLEPQVSVLYALNLALSERDGISIRIERDGMYHVEIGDGDEWGRGPDLDTALRYALGAHFAPEEV
jgi:hypothetical protein